MAKFRVDLLGKPDTLRVHFTATGRIRKASGGKGSAALRVAPLGIRHDEPGRTWFEETDSPTCVYVIAVGPMGWWHDGKSVPVGTSFDEIVRATYLPGWYGWDTAE